MYNKSNRFYEPQMSEVSTNKEKRFYTPQFSEKASVTVRRLAWAMGVPMTKEIEIIINELSLVFSSSVICTKCQDSTKCQTCAFNNQAAAVKTANAA